jgi:polysaccharide export outer membrane protein
MRNRLGPIQLLWTLLCSLCLLCASHTQAADRGYRLKEGDAIHISVWGEDTLNQETRVLPDGNISFPLVGYMKISGLTAPEVEAVITEGLQEYIPDPDVSVVVTATDGNRVYVLGKVAQPGPIIMTTPLTVMEALSLSGGLGTFADENKIRILRRSSAGEEQLEVRYKDIMSGKDISTNHQLEAGDTILVP